MTSYFAFHSPTKVQHENLTKEEIKKKLLEDTNLSNWLIWMPGMAEWKSADEMDEIKNLLKQMSTPPPLPMPTPPPLPPAAKLGSKESDDFVVIDFADEVTVKKSVAKEDPAPENLKAETGKPVLEPAAPKKSAAPKSEPAAPPSEAASGGSNKRQHPRIKGRLRTIITNRERAFITYTRDLSLGGVLLEHSIPEDLLMGSVDIFITGPTGKDSIVFRCQPIKNEAGHYRFTFVTTDQKNQDKLSAWLNHLGQALS